MLGYIPNYCPRNVPWENQWQASLILGTAAAIGIIALIWSARKIVEWIFDE